MKSSLLRSILAAAVIAITACEAQNPNGSEVQENGSPLDTSDAADKDTTDAQLERPDFPCDCFYPSFEIIYPDSPKSTREYTIDLCAPLNQERRLSLALRVFPCSPCGGPTCLFQDVAVCTHTRPTCPSDETEYALNLGFKVLVPPGSNGTPQTGVEYGQDDEITLELVFEPTKASEIGPNGSAVPDEVLLNVLLECGPSHPPPPVRVRLTAFEGECPL
jgi:hypothetical protein